MHLRQMSGGHVLTIGSIEGHMIRLSLQSGGQAMLSLSEPDVEGIPNTPTSTVNGSTLEEDVFTPIVSC